MCTTLSHVVCSQKLFVKRRDSRVAAPSVGTSASPTSSSPPPPPPPRSVAPQEAFLDSVEAAASSAGRIGTAPLSVARSWPYASRSRRGSRSTLSPRSSCSLSLYQKNSLTSSYMTRSPTGSSRRSKVSRRRKRYTGRTTDTRKSLAGYGMGEPGSRYSEVEPGRSGGVCGGSLTALAAQWKTSVSISGAWRRLAASPQTSCHSSSWCSCAVHSQRCSSSAVAKAKRPVVSHLEAVSEPIVVKTSPGP